MGGSNTYPGLYRRTLVKEGHPEALTLLGVSTKVPVDVGRLHLSEKQLRMGEKLKFSFSVKSLSEKEQKLIIDYRIHFIRSNGKPSVKVFKLKNLMLGPKAPAEIEKIHHIKEVTTREYYNGPHVIDIQINGIVKKSGKFILSGAKDIY